MAIDKRTGERRNEARLAVSRRAILKYGGGQFPCLIQDMGMNGFFIVCNKPFLPRQLVELSCELFPAQVLECTLEIRHVDDSGIGTMIVQIDERGKALCLRLLQDLYSDKLHSLDARTTR